MNYYWKRKLLLNKKTNAEKLCIDTRAKLKWKKVKEDCLKIDKDFESKKMTFSKKFLNMIEKRNAKQKYRKCI